VPRGITGTNVVRFFSDQSAQLGVDTRDGKPMTKLNLNKTVAPVVAVPHDIHASSPIALMTAATTYPSLSALERFENESGQGLSLTLSGILVAAA
jgi:hypothetical protein